MTKDYILDERYCLHLKRDHNTFHYSVYKTAPVERVYFSSLIVFDADCRSEQELMEMVCRYAVVDFNSHIRKIREATEEDITDLLKSRIEKEEKQC